MTDPYANFKEPDVVKEGAFSDLNDLIKLMEEREELVAKAEDALKEAKNNLKSVVEFQIPELLEEMGMQEFTDTAGRKIKIVTKIRASLPEKNKPAAFAWLEAQGHGGLIKRTINVAFNREQKDEAQALAEKLRSEFAGVQQVMKVEPATLTSFVKGQLEAGDEVPLDIFTVFEQKVAKVTQPKKK